jgi:hypothetical protein
MLPWNEFRSGSVNGSCLSICLLAGRLDDIRSWATLKRGPLLSIHNKQVASLSLTEVHDHCSFVPKTGFGVREQSSRFS